jgi:signal transduction histidine kinase
VYHPLTRDAFLTWTHVGTEILIGTAHLAIALMLAYVVRYFKNDLAFQWVFLALICVFAGCGLTRFVEAVAHYYPVYRLEIAVKTFTTAAVVLTAVFLPTAFPKLKSMIERAKEKQVEANRRADQMNQSLREANHAKDEFLAIVSHELRTPMTAVLGWVQLMSKITDTDLCRECSQHDLFREGLGQVKMSCQTQARLVDDLLDMSRVTLGKFSVRLMPVDIRGLVTETVESLRPVFEVKEVTLHQNLEDVGFVQGDPVRLRQVVWNLLYNAIKFTDAGGECDIILDKVRGYARITVKDTGRGIPLTDLPTIFEKLSKASGPPSSHGGGLGLGLSLAKTIVDLHGGNIYADSGGEGQGSSFTFVLPLLH